MKKLKNLLANALPLALGLSLGIVLIAKTCFELSYDSFYRDLDRIYLIKTFFSRNGEESNYERTSGAVAPGFRQYVPGVETATRITGVFGSRKYMTSDKRLIEADGNFVCADTSFFDIFNRRILAGDCKEILGRVGGTMVSESFAEKLGGPEKAMGMTISNTDAPDIKLTIAGIFEDFPKNGSVDVDVILSMESYSKNSTENWIGNDRYMSYVKLGKGVDPSELTDAIRLMQEKNQPLEEIEKDGTRLVYYLTPFDSMHTSDKYVKMTVTALTVITLLLLTISVLNFLLNSISAVTERSRTFATRKCYGAENRDIYGILFKESALTLLVSLAITAAILAACSNLIRDLLGVSLADMMLPASYMTVIAAIAAVFIFTAVIPGAIYNRIPVTAALRKYSDNKRRWKHILLISQFTINVFLLGMLSIIAVHYNKVSTQETGYDYKNVYMIYVGGFTPEKIREYYNRLSAIEGVRDVIMTTELPMSYASGNNISLPGTDRELFNIADKYYNSKGTLAFYDIPVLEGREPLAADEVAVSRRFVEKMNGFTDWSDGAVGKQIIVTEHSQSQGPENAFTVCGVYEDYLIGSYLSRDDRPSIMFYGDENSYMEYIVLKTDSHSPEIQSAIERELLEINPERPDIEVLSYEEKMTELYSTNRKIRDTFIVGCIIILLISISGLAGYTGNEASRRRKEIALRKINGATASDILKLFIKDTLKMAAIAIIIADVLIGAAAKGYMSFFSEKLQIGPQYFILADVALIIIACTTVAVNCIRISASNPAEYLRNE